MVEPVRNLQLFVGFTDLTYLLQTFSVSPGAFAGGIAGEWK